MLPIERLVRLIAPHTCLGCGLEEDHLICAACWQTVPQVPSRCYHCRAVSADYAVCTSCRSRTSLRRVAVVAHYADLAKELVHRSKYERARAGLCEMAAVMVPLLDSFGPGIVLVPVPTASSRVRLRGYDHARLLVRELVRLTRLPMIPLLARLGQAHQVGASRAQRMAQLEYAFRPLRADQIRGKHLVLVDDVLTSGATLETAARVLKRAGAKRIDAVVFAQAK